MHTDARPKLPFKGPILIYASVVLALGGLARLAEDTLARLQGAQGVTAGLVEHELEVGTGAAPAPAEAVPAALQPLVPLGALGPEEAEALLGAAGADPAAGAPSAGVPSAGFTSRADEEEPVPTYLMDRAQRLEHRGPGAAHAPMDPGGRHGGPAVPRPCNVAFRLVDDQGAPVAALRVDVRQSGSDGTHDLRAYRTGDGGSSWIAGSPELTPGRCASFDLRVTDADGAVLHGRTLGRAPTAGDVELGAVRLSGWSEAADPAPR